MILAHYRCGCTWVGIRKHCLSYCSRHGDPRKQVLRYPKVPANEQGWSWELKK